MRTGMMWQPLEEPEKMSVAAQIDAQDPSNRYGAGALTIARVDLRFYPGAHLLRVSSKSPMAGNRYFIQRGEELVALHSFDDIQPSCDKRFDLTLNSGTAADYFRF